MRSRCRCAPRGPSSDPSGSSSNGERRSTATRSPSPASSPTSPDRRSSVHACTSPSVRSGARSTASSSSPRGSSGRTQTTWWASSAGRPGRRSARTTASCGGCATRGSTCSRSIRRVQTSSRRRLRLDDFPRLREAIEGLGASFVPDVLETTYGEGFDFVRELGIRSSLRTPVVIAGSSELVLAISWQVVVSEPDQATLAVVRRFADQAGLALEQVERRRAEADAERRADATRRLQEVTAALSVATTVLDVSNACLEKALESVGAEAGFVVLKGPSGHEHGRDRHELGLRRRQGSRPGRRSISTRTSPSHARSPPASPSGRCRTTEMSAFTGVREARAAGWVSLPLVTRGGARGALHLSFRSPRSFTEEDRAWLQSMVVAVRSGARARKSVRGRADHRGDAAAQCPAELPSSGGRRRARGPLPARAAPTSMSGGDWFDVLQLPDGKLGLVVGDVVGKGVQAAASMAQLRNAIRAFSVDRLKPSSVLVRLNRLADEVLDTSFATLAYLALEPDTGVCRLSSAGHPPPVVAYPDGRVELIESARGLPLGTGLRATYRQQMLELPAGSVVVLYTDGLIERRGRSIDEGLQKLRGRRGNGAEGPGPASRAHPRARHRRRRARRRHRAPRRPRSARRATAARATAPGRPRLHGARARRDAHVAARGRARALGRRGRRPRHLGGMRERHRARARACGADRRRPRRSRRLADQGHDRRHRAAGRRRRNGRIAGSASGSWKRSSPPSSSPRARRAPR